MITYEYVERTSKSDLKRSLDKMDYPALRSALYLARGYADKKHRYLAKQIIKQIKRRASI